MLAAVFWLLGMPELAPLSPVFKEPATVDAAPEAGSALTAGALVTTCTSVGWFFDKFDGLETGEAALPLTESDEVMSGVSGCALVVDVTVVVSL